MLVAFIVGAALLDWQKALFLIVIPQQFALFAILLFNYMQHIHADEESEYNHSRNFVGPMLNTLLFPAPTRQFEQIRNGVAIQEGSGMQSLSQQSIKHFDPSGLLGPDVLVDVSLEMPR